MFAVPFQSCQEPCLLCEAMQVRHTAMLHFFKPLCSLSTDLMHVSTFMRYMTAMAKCTACLWVR